MEAINLTRQFLIAMPAMADPIFAKSLVYVVDPGGRLAYAFLNPSPEWLREAIRRVEP